MATLTITLTTHEGEDAGRVFGDILRGLSQAVSGKEPEPRVEMRHEPAFVATDTPGYSRSFRMPSAQEEADNPLPTGWAKKVEPAPALPEPKPEPKKAEVKPEPKTAPLYEWQKSRSEMFTGPRSSDEMRDELGDLKVRIGKLHSSTAEWKAMNNRISTLKKELEKRGEPLQIVSSFDAAKTARTNGAMSGQSL